jgi:hypothetical protein
MSRRKRLALRLAVLTVVCGALLVLPAAAAFAAPYQPCKPDGSIDGIAKDAAAEYDAENDPNSPQHKNRDNRNPGKTNSVGSDKDLARQLLGSGTAGPCPTAAYKIYFSTGGGLVGKPVNVIFGTLTEMIFGLVRFVVPIALWLLRFAYSFPVIHALEKPASDMTITYKHVVIDQPKLIGFMLTLAFAYTALQVMRGRTANGVGEFTQSLLVYALALILLASPLNLFRDATDTVRTLSGSLLSLAMENDKSAPPGCPTPERLADTDPKHEAFVATTYEPFACRLQYAVIAVPFDVLNWGQSADGTPCAKYRDEVLAENPSLTDDRVRKLMNKDSKNCSSFAKFNEDPSANRLISALLLAVGGLVLLVMIILMAFTVLISQFFAVVLLTFAWPAFAIGILPGGGRRALARWASSITAALAAVVVTAGFLSFVVWILTVVLKTTSEKKNAGFDVPMIQRFLLLDVAAIGLIIWRGRILDASKNAIKSFGARVGESGLGALGAGGGGGGGGGSLGGSVGQLGAEHVLDRMTARAGRNALARGYKGLDPMLSAHAGADGANIAATVGMGGGQRGGRGRSYGRGDHRGGAHRLLNRLDNMTLRRGHRWSTGRIAGAVRLGAKPVKWGLKGADTVLHLPTRGARAMAHAANAGSAAVDTAMVAGSAAMRYGAGALQGWGSLFLPGGGEVSRNFQEVRDDYMTRPLPSFHMPSRTRRQLSQDHYLLAGRSMQDARRDVAARRTAQARADSADFRSRRRDRHWNANRPRRRPGS